MLRRNVGLSCQLHSSKTHKNILFIIITVGVSDQINLPYILKVINQYCVYIFSDTSRESVNFQISDNMTTMKDIIFRAYQHFSVSKCETDTYYISIIGCVLESIDFANYTILIQI
jgi:hypothetical protein